MSPRFLNCVLRGLPPDATQHDVEQHILAITPCRPHVHAVVRDRQTPTSSATVSLRLNGSSAADVLPRLNGSQFRGLRNYRIVVDRDFLGLNTLVDPDGSNFDFCFVHGLGGHAFDSWTAYSSQEDDPPFMWPRDFLPARFANEGMKARFLTYGHPANVIVRANAQATISTAAEQLLSHFMADRRQHPDRPIYFVCHSLGGLIVCQALIDCLCADAGFTIKPDYRNIFMQNGTCMVKGIVFFGTPFRGTGQANFIYPIIKMLSKQYLWPINEDLVRSLKNRQLALGQILGRFDRIRKQNLIQLLPCYESIPVVGTQLTTNRESAIAAFDRDVAPLEIIADHHKMIKFNHNQDANYRSVEDRIIYMVASTAPQSSAQPGTEPATWGYARGDNSSPAEYLPPGLSHRSSHSSSSPLAPLAGTPPRFAAAPPTQNQAPFSSGHHGHASSGSFGRPAQTSQTNNSPISPPTSQYTIPGVRQAPSNHSPVELPAATQGLSRMSISPPSAASLGINQEYLELLSAYDTVFIIDDTGSMQKPVLTVGTPAFYPPSPPNNQTLQQQQPTNIPDRWAALKMALETFVPIAAEHDTDGIDVRFLKNVALNDRADAKGIKDITRVRRLLQRIQLADPICAGGTFFKDQLQAAIEPRMVAIREWAIKRRRNRFFPQPKPLNLIVITDGEADDEAAVDEYIISVARELGTLKAPKSYIGIQFVQIGDDVEAADYLRRLDDELHVLTDGETVRDIVDTTPFRGHWVEGPELTQIRADETQNFAKILLGAIVEMLDKLANRMTPPQSEDESD